MKQSFLFLLTMLLMLTASSQLFKKDDVVEADLLLSDSAQRNWKTATVLDFDSIGKKYTVKFLDGNKMTIASTDPEKWIRPYIDRQLPVNKYGPGARIVYEKRVKVIKPLKCNASEVNIKKSIKSMMAMHFKDYQNISVDFTSFKGQHGYEDKNHKGQQVYPYKIEMLVHLKRTVTMGGIEYTEYQTWEFDRVYEYASRPGKKCEFYAIPSTDAELLSRRWYY